MEGISSTTDASHQACHMVLRSLLICIEELKKKSSLSENCEELLKDKDESIRRLNERLEKCQMALKQAEMQRWNNQNAISNLARSSANHRHVESTVNRTSEYKGSAEAKQAEPVFRDIETDSLPLLSDFDYKSSVSMLSSLSLEQAVGKISEEKSLRSVQDPVNTFTPDASEDLIKKLMCQNTRLKKTMRDILELKGLTLSDYLDKQEYEDIVDHQREELKQMKTECDELRKIIASGSNMTELQSLCSEQLKKISQLTRSVNVQKALVESYSQQYEQVKDELNACRGQLLVKEQQINEPFDTEATSLAKRAVAESKMQISENLQTRERISQQKEATGHRGQSSDGNGISVRLLHPPLASKTSSAAAAAAAATTAAAVEATPMVSTRPTGLPTVTEFKESSASATAAAVLAGTAEVLAISSATVVQPSAVLTVATARSQPAVQKWMSGSAADPTGTLAVPVASTVQRRPTAAAAPLKSSSASLLSRTVGSNTLTDVESNAIVSIDGSRVAYLEHSSSDDNGDDEYDEDGGTEDFECPRCEKRFCRQQRGKWDEHTLKCVD